MLTHAPAPTTCPAPQHRTPMSQPGRGGRGSAPHSSQSHRGQHPVCPRLNERSYPPARPTVRQVCSNWFSNCLQTILGQSLGHFPGAQIILALEWRGNTPHLISQKNNTGINGEIFKSKSPRSPLCELPSPGTLNGHTLMLQCVQGLSE